MGIKRQKKNYMLFRRPRTRTIRTLNNLYVINQLTRKALVEVRAEMTSVKANKLKFPVPVVTGEKIETTRRKTKILRLLDNAIDRHLHKQAIVSAVATAEDYLAGVLELILRSFPQKLQLTIAGNEGDKLVSLDDVIKARDKNSLLSSIIEKRIVQVFYAPPRTYFRYLSQVLSLQVPEDFILQYIEIKATRDLLVHNEGKVNSIYLAKVGGLARAAVDDLIPLDENYIDETIRCLKRLTGLIYKKCLSKFGEVVLSPSTST